MASVEPTQNTFEKKRVAFDLAENLRNVAELGIEIINGVEGRQKKNLPKPYLLRLVLSFLDTTFPSDGYIEVNGEEIVNKKAINDFDPKWAFYLLNEMQQEMTTELHQSVLQRDEDYFYENFDDLFGDFNTFGFDVNLGAMKELIKLDIDEELKDELWDYFTAISTLVYNSMEN